MTDKNGPEGPGLEERLHRLEEILAKLESQDLELGAALELFQEGVEHIRRSEALLAQAELQVEELLGEGQDAETRPFPGGTDSADSQ
jgi:exodeoxyribonuclease VII small subunit